MLQIQNLNYSIGERDLLRNISWIINPGQRVALIGPNGAGKTTLLRILSGMVEADEQHIIKPKNYSIGYLPQEEIVLDEQSVLVSVLQGHHEILQLEDDISEIHRMLEMDQQNMDLINKLGLLEDRFRHLSGYELEARAKKILSGLGFENDEYKRSVTELSGGWQMRVYLARLLLQQPDLLLLDEPTNHLDLEALEWIENYLRSFEGSIVLVSHDRFFIDRLAQEIAELYRGKLTTYKGNYHFYEKQKILYEEQQIKKWQEQQEERARLQKFIDRFRYKASKAVQVQSRIKRLEKLEDIEIPEEKKKIHFKIKADTQSYKEVLSVADLWFRYEHAWVLRNININVYRGDKIALVGVNGAGKTTLTRLISNELVAEQGTLKLGERVHPGYYAQHQIEALNLSKNIYDEVLSTAAPSFRAKLRDILGVFQFSGDEVNKPVGVLSGGEKARVSLAKILLSPGNFLIMDEPTNHLDLASKEALEEALYEYDGTLLLISHDRYFLDKLVNRVFELKDGKINIYEGNYSEYLSKVRSVLNPEADVIKPEKEYKSSSVKSSPASGPKSKEQKKTEALARQSISKDRNRLLKKIEQLELEIDQLENDKQKLEDDLADPQTYQNGERSRLLKGQYSTLEKTLAEKEKSWESTQLELEVILREIGAE